MPDHTDNTSRLDELRRGIDAIDADLLPLRRYRDPQRRGHDDRSARNTGSRFES